MFPVFNLRQDTDTIVFLAPMEIDEYDLVDPVDILTPLEKSGFWDGVVCDLSCIDILPESY